MPPRKRQEVGSTPGSTDKEPSTARAAPKKAPAKNVTSERAPASDTGRKTKVSAKNSTATSKTCKKKPNNILSDEVSYTDEEDDDDFEDDSYSLEEEDTYDEHVEGYGPEAIEIEDDVDSGDDASLPARKRLKTGSEQLERHLIQSLTKTGSTKSTVLSHSVCMSGLDGSEPPRSSIKAIFYHMTEKALKVLCGCKTPAVCQLTTIHHRTLDDYLQHMNSRKLRVATMCSGTESPILALKLISQYLQSIGLNLDIDHLFSAELVDWKQHYIQTNFNPPILLRDVTEFLNKQIDENTPRKLFTAFGSEVVVPGDIDLLVAGTCCVDYSPLNRHQRGLEDMGESGRTFFGTLTYMKEDRPKLVILENVESAPFLNKVVNGVYKNGMEFYIHKVGYATRYIKLDTKNFYLPHTRRRSYMLCVDLRSAYQAYCPDAKIDPTDEDISAFKESKVLNPLFDAWESKVKILGGGASVAVDNLLLPPGDLRVSALQEDGLRLAKARNSTTPWEKCKVGHADYRNVHGLGNKHVITEWHDTTFTLPDFYDRDVKGFVQRVCDTIDTSHLRNVTRGFDDRYYSRTLELSQNVYRDENKSKNGIVGCLTPTGMPFNTLKGRKMNGVEALILQGLPVDDLDLVNLSQDNLRNLAGNAMTSTVVGATILSALSIFGDILPRGTEIVERVKPPAPTHRGEESLILQNSDPASYECLPVTVAKSLAASTSMMCDCESRDWESMKNFQACKTCKHTTCTRCGGSPKHDYVPISNKESRQELADFIATIRRSIPSILSLTNSDQVAIRDILQTYAQTNEAHIDPGTWNGIYDRLIKVITSSPCLRGISRGKSWEITYDCSDSRVILIISGNNIEWSIYADVSDLPINDEFGAYLRKYPVFRMQPGTNGLDITQGQWKIWLPKVSTLHASITSNGPLVPSYHCGIGLTAHADERVASAVEISFKSSAVGPLENDISGKYRSVPECGQAFNSFHVKVGTEDSQSPVYFFLEHEMATGNPNDHSYIFTNDCKKHSSVGTPRSYFASVDSSWRQPIFNSSKDTERSEAITIHVPGIWNNIDHLGFEPPPKQHISFEQLHSNSTDLRGSCDIQYAVLNCHADLGTNVNKLWLRDQWISIDNSTSTLFRDDFSWFLAQGLIILPFISSNDQWHPYTATCTDKCSTCVPIAPSRLWKLITTKKNSGGRNYPFEKPDEAASFEKTLKALPPALSVNINITPSGQFFLKLGMNPITLIHRSIARLSGSSNITTSWRLVTDDSKFTRKRLPHLQIQSSHREPESWQPDQFKVVLRPEQLRALHWMKNQESKPESFSEEEITEGRVSSLDYYLWGKATRDVCVRGGVLAFDVGFGKTAVTIGLINSQNSNQGGKKDSQWIKKEFDGVIPLKATVIFVPKHLPTQWNEEVQKFASDRKKVVLIKVEKDLTKKTVADFQSADIIIVNSDILNTDGYRKLVAQFAGMVEHEDNATPRAKHEWYEKALPSIRNNVNELLRNPEGMHDHLEGLYNDDLESAKSQVLPTTIKRVIGTAYSELHADTKNPFREISSDDDLESAKGPVLPTKTECVIGEAYHAGTKRPFKAISSDEDLNSNPKPYTDPFKLLNLSNVDKFTSPIFEMFGFARVVVDEFSYISTGSNLFSLLQYLSSQAWSKWLLSGTPSLAGFADVKIMASLLSINLGEDDKTLKPDLPPSKIIEMTDAEKFVALRQTFSPSLRAYRHSHAQKFLNQFARKDVADIGAIKFTEHLRLLHLPPTEYGLYLELTQRMVATDFEAKNFHHTGNDSLDRMRDSMHGCDDGREALITRASTFHLNDDDDEELTSGLGTAQNSADVIVKIREHEVKQHLATFEKELKLTQWLERNQLPNFPPSPNFANWQSRVKEGCQYGDMETSNILSRCINQARISYREDHRLELFRDPADKNDTRPLRPKGMCKGNNTHLSQVTSEIRICTSRLNRFGEDHMNLIRSLRFFEAVRQIQSCPHAKHSRRVNTGIICSNCGSDSIRLDVATILSKCGHTICNAPCSRMIDGTCPVAGCDAISKPMQAIPGRDLVATDDPNVTSVYGKKLDDLVTLVQQTPYNEKVLIFVQFENLIGKVQTALEAGGIITQALLKSSTPANLLTALELFQRPMPQAGLEDTKKQAPKAGSKGKNQNKGPSKVLILNIGDETASGSNLTMANHVIFVAPYLTKGPSAQHTYQAAMMQAIGRSRRFGQTKRVHVYHFLAAKTIDVDIFEKRSQKVLKVIDHPVEEEESPFEGFECSRVALVERGEKDVGEFTSYAVREIFSPGSVYA